LQADDISGFHANTHIPIVVGSQQRYEITGDLLHKVSKSNQEKCDIFIKEDIGSLDSEICISRKSRCSLWTLLMLHTAMQLEEHQSKSSGTTITWL